MIQATARVLRNVIEIELEDESWVAKPVVTSSGPITRAIAALFSTTYETYRVAEPNVVHSTVSYSAKKDEILIQIGESKWRTRSSLFGPLVFEYGGVNYELHEKLTGRFAIFHDGVVIASGQLGFRSCEVREYPQDLSRFLGNFALGYLIRNLFWEMLR